MALTTDVAIKKWKAGKDGEAVGTGGRNSLYVRGWMSGSKAFYFRGKTWVKIGDYPDTSLATARELATVAKRLSREGYGLEALQRGFANASTGTELEAIVTGAALTGLSASGLITAPTYDQVWREWFDGRRHKLQEGPSRRRPEAIHLHHIKPAIGDRPITEIRRREIFDLLEPLFREKPVTAGHALGHITAVFERAANRELIDANPTPRKIAFEDALKGRGVRHHGTMSNEKMPELWQWLQNTGASTSARLAILTAMVTAHRLGVVVHAEWAHIDETTGVWTVPARTDKTTLGRMKSGRQYALKLPPDLLVMLRDLRTDPRQQFVFESPTTRGPITGAAIVKILKRFDPGMTAHGFRNAIKIWCGQKIDPKDENSPQRFSDREADLFCDHSLRGLDKAYRRKEADVLLRLRSDIAAQLYEFVTAPKAEIPPEGNQENM
ncbi:MAG: tyrosine-type recombinase/integrase [Rhodobacterales bacterium]